MPDYHHVTIGIDPGLGGAIAVLGDGLLLYVEDMPVTDGEVNGPLLHTMLKEWDQWHPAIPSVIVEQVAAFPKNGSIGNFKLGLGYGVILGCVAGLNLPLYRSRPAVWKKGMGLSSDKERSRAKAIDLWPQHSELFKFKKNADRAEAALLGRWHWENGQR